jgi:diguanylate cyclase (GGDEF)-like protein/PAS domain S-box-containing protein
MARPASAPPGATLSLTLSVAATLGIAATAFPGVALDADGRLLASATQYLGEHALVLAGIAVAVVVLAFACAAIARELRVRRGTERSVRESEQRYRAAVERSADGFFLLEAVRAADGTIVDFALADVNPRGSELLGRVRAGLVGAHLTQLLSAHRSAALIARYGHVLDTGQSLVEETRADGAELDATWLWHQAVAVEGGVAVTTRDIGERKRAEDALRRTTLTDELTGLKNRRGFTALGEHQLKVSRRTGSDVVVLYADLDGFKRINDTFGHAEGDRALRDVADVLRNAFRDTDVIARLGGDEFTVLLVGGDQCTADTVIARVRAMLDARNAAPDRRYRLTISFGVARLDRDREMSLDDLLGAADMALYAAKRRRKQQAA